jgi:hypothetical protein
MYPPEGDPQPASESGCTEVKWHIGVMKGSRVTRGRRHEVRGSWPEAEGTDEN